MPGPRVPPPRPWKPPPEPDWCERDCEGAPTAWTSPTVKQVVRHLHLTCWQCGAPVITNRVREYTCQVCDCSQAGPYASSTDPTFDADAAANRPVP